MENSCVKVSGTEGGRGCTVPHWSRLACQDKEKTNTIRQKMAQLMILAFGPKGERLRGGQLQLMPHPSEHWTINRLIFHIF